jgi:hypothetical protein
MTDATTSARLLAVTVLEGDANGTSNGREELNETELAPDFLVQLGPPLIQDALGPKGMGDLGSSRGEIGSPPWPRPFQPSSMGLAFNPST